MSRHVFFPLSPASRQIALGWDRQLASFFLHARSVRQLGGLSISVGSTWRAISRPEPVLSIAQDLCGLSLPSDLRSRLLHDQVFEGASDVPRVFPVSSDLGRAFAFRELQGLPEGSELSDDLRQELVRFLLSSACPLGTVLVWDGVLVEGFSEPGHSDLVDQS